MFKLLRLFARRRRNKNRRVPVVRRTYLSDGSGYVQQILGSTKPGEKKLQFPYELPVIETSVSLDKSTRNTLLGVAGGIAGGMIISSAIKRSKN